MPSAENGGEIGEDDHKIFTQISTLIQCVGKGESAMLDFCRRKPIYIFTLLHWYLQSFNH